MLSSTSFTSFHEAVRAFLDKGDIPGTIVTACFGVPGPNIGGLVHATNLNWLIDVAALPGLLGIPRVAILNDLDMAAVITYQRNAFGNNMGDSLQAVDVYKFKSKKIGE